MKRAASDSGTVSSSQQQHKRRRRSTFSQHSYPVVRGGGGNRPLVLLRLPEEVELAPPDVASYLYPEEVMIEEDEADEQQAAAEQQAKGQQRRRRARPSVQWVLESGARGAARLTGVKRPLGDEVEQHCRYFVMMINDNEPDGAASEGGGGSGKGKGKGKGKRKQCELLPLEDVIVLRHAHVGEGALSEEVKDFIQHGRRVDLQAREWQAKYGTAGKALVAAWDACAVEDEVGSGRARGPRLLQQQGPEGPEQGPKRWVRTFRVDEDADAGEDSFNPSTKVAPGYQDILGDAGDDNVEAVAGVFNETDLGMDEVPDGADEGFGAPEFGEEDHVRVRDGQQQMLLLEENAPSIDPILREMEGLRDEDSEDDAGMYGTSSDEEDEEQGAAGDGGGPGGGLFVAPSRPAGAGAAAGAAASGGGVVFAEGFAALERAGFGSDSHSDYDGDDDDSEDEG